MKASQLFHWSDQFNQSLQSLYHQSQNIDLAHFNELSAQLMAEIAANSGQTSISPAEETILVIVEEHINLAFQLCLQAQINRHHYHAVINREGHILYNSDSSNSHIIKSKALLKKIDTALSEKNESVAFEINGTIVFCQLCDHLLMLRLWDMSAYQDRLTQKELMVACLIGQFKSNNEISAQLNSSVKTIENQLTKIYQKLSLSNRAQLISLLNQ